MTLRAAAALVAASAAYLVLVVTAAARVGANYEEVVPYVLTRLDIRDSGAPPADDAGAPRFVTSAWLPRLAFEPTRGLQLPLLNQPYMTNHLSYGGVALGTAGIDRLWAARLWHLLFGLVLLWLLYDVGRLLGLGARAELLAVAIAATGLQLTICYTLARFDESLPSFGAVAVLWAALHYSRTPRTGWIWVGVVSSAVAVSGKLTALWPLAGLAVAGRLAGWRPPRARALALPVLVAVPLLAPIVGYAIAAPVTGEETGRRLGFLADLFTSDAIPGTAANLIDYLGSWGAIISGAIRGSDVRAPNLCGRLLVLGTLAWLIARACARGPIPSRRRLETQMLAVLGVVFTLVALFYRERRDYQFILLVPLYALAIAAFLEWCAMSLGHRLPAWAASAVIFALPVGSNLWEQHGLHADLALARNAMVDLDAQRASAGWLASHDAHRPIVVTFYAVGTYELLTDGAVRPVYVFPLFRHANGDPNGPDLVAAWRTAFADDPQTTRFVVLPIGENPIEATYFDEPIIRSALLEAAQGTRVLVFNNRHGDPVLEVWQITPRPQSTTALDVP